jgi:hypothetical protein
VDGNYDFYIDVYSKSKSTAADNGDKLAAMHVQKIVGIIRTIFQSPVYNTLGFAKPFNCTTSISEINFGTVSDKDENNVQMARITFNVIVPESLKFVSPVLIYEFNTQVRIGDSRAGYIFTGYAQENLPNDDEVIVNINGNYFGTYNGGSIVNIGVQYQNGILTGVIAGNNVIVPDVIYSKSISIGDPRIDDNIPLFYSDASSKVWQINDICRGGTIRYNIYFAEEQDEINPTPLWDDDRTINQSSGSETSTIDTSIIPTNSWVWIKLLDVDGSVSMFSVNLIYTNIF